MIISYLPWLLSAITIYMTVLAGNKHRHAWAVGLVNQALWLVWIVATQTWGLLPMNLALWFVYGRNHLRWAHEQGAPVVAGKRVPPKDPQRPRAVEALRPVPAHDASSPLTPVHPQDQT